jgi:F420-dependent oxidoreductase-like protein
MACQAMSRRVVVKVGGVRLGLNMGYLLGSDVSGYVTLARAAEDLGYDVLWAAEAYGSDSPTLLAYLAAKTTRIGVGAAVMQIPARTPAMTAMTAASLDLLSQGRFRLGLGVSGPQVSEGWHGVAFDRPLSRTREYVDIVTQALRRETVRYAGEHFTLPLPGGPGKALKLAVHPVRSRVPLYLAAVGPRNLELAGEIADGWLAIFFSPEYADELLGAVRRGQQRGGREAIAFDVSATVPVSLGPDLEACVEPIRGYAALYVGGMGSREQNFYNALARRMGFEQEAQQVQDLFLAREHRAAAAAVPLDFIDQTSLLGPPERMQERLHAFASAGVTTLNVSLFEKDPARAVSTLRRVAAALEASGLAD